MHSLHKLVKLDLVRGLPLYGFKKVVCVVHVLEVSKYILPSNP